LSLILRGRHGSGAANKVLKRKFISTEEEVTRMDMLPHKNLHIFYSLDIIRAMKPKRMNCKIKKDEMVRTCSKYRRFQVKAQIYENSGIKPTTELHAYVGGKHEIGC
jgi:hypothetical protein